MCALQIVVCKKYYVQFDFYDCLGLWARTLFILHIIINKLICYRYVYAKCHYFIKHIDPQHMSYEQQQQQQQTDYSNR